jgi:hypothetical protein
LRCFSQPAHQDFFQLGLRETTRYSLGSIFGVDLMDFRGRLFSSPAEALRRHQLF